jgi:HD-GYP domain-containing protein (c-di-GMP phosphodiesterase class II)
VALFQQQELETHIVHELIDDINDHYEISEKTLFALENAPNDSELLRSLFQSVHTIKGDLGIVSFSPAIPLVTAAEELLSLLRDGQMHYEPMISDVVLLMLDRVKAQVEEFRSAGELSYQPGEYDELVQTFSTLSKLSDAARKESIAAAIRSLDPSVVEQPAEQTSSRQQISDYLSAQGVEEDEDVLFFRDLMGPVESRSQYWLGRSDRILRMSQILNQLAGSPVDKQQLAVAVYVHDFGMACMPLDVLHKQGTLTHDEIVLLRSHVISGVNLLQNMPKWKVAAGIVMQHHEAVNGSGYPYGLRDKDICDGAKILAIADTFDALTHQRAYASHQKRPIIRAVKEINECAGKTLSHYWVDIFNKAVEPVLRLHRDGIGDVL